MTHLINLISAIRIRPDFFSIEKIFFQMLHRARILTKNFWLPGKNPQKNFLPSLRSGVTVLTSLRLVDPPPYIQEKQLPSSSFPRAAKNAPGEGNLYRRG